MMVLGDCSGCETCGSQTCDVIAFLFGQGAEPMPAINYTAFNEGATPTLTVARLPDVFGYHGTPADYETNEGNPPPLVSGDYFYNYDDRTFWYNNGGTWETSPGPTSYGTGEVVVSYAITRPECGCPHMWTADTGTLTWADGDIADKTITLTALAHAGTVPFWACAGSPYYGEAATCTLSLVSDDPARCTNIGNPATLAAVCTHTVTNSGWGTDAPYTLRKWGGVYQPSAGQIGFRNEEYYLREEETTAGTTSGDSVDYKYAKEFAAEGDVVLEDSYKDSAFLAQFSRPVSLTVPVMLPVVQTGLPASTPGNTSDFSLASGRGFEGQVITLQATTPFYGNITYEWKKNGSVVASGSSSTPATLTYTLPGSDSTDSGSYTLEITHNPPVVGDPLICDSSEIVILDQALNTISDSSVDVSGSGGGETWQWTGAMTTQVEADPAGIAEDRMDTAKGLYADGNLASFPGDDDFGHYGWDQVQPDEWTWKIRASNGNYDFSDPGFDSTKTYEFTGADLPDEPFDPSDWAEIADTGYEYQRVTSGWTQTIGASGITSATAGTSGYAGRLISGGDYYVYSSTIDATRSASGSPYPYMVEIRMLDYEDGVLISTGAWVDITDTVYDVDQPASMGGATSHKKYDVEFRLTPLAGVGCTPTGSPVFVCHPGLSC